MMDAAARPGRRRRRLRAERHAEAVRHRDEVADGRAAGAPGGARPGAPTCRACPCRRRRSSARGWRTTCRRTAVWDGMDLKTLYRLSWGGKNARRRRVRAAGAPRTSSRGACACRRRALRDGWLALARRLRLLALRGRRRGPGGLRRRRRAASSGASPSRARRCTTASPSPTTSAPSTTTSATSWRSRSSPPGTSRRRTSTSCRPPASTRRRTSRTAWRSPRRRASPRRCTGGSSASSGIGAGQGRRYSWGYPACPDLDHHALVCDLLGAAGVDRRRPDLGVPARPRAVDGGDRRAPPERDLLLRAAQRARQRLGTGNRHADGYRIVPAASPRCRGSRVDSHRRGYLN